MVACLPSTTTALLLLASSTLAVLALSTLSATRAISLAPPTLASSPTLATRRLLLLTRLLLTPSRLAPVLARSEGYLSFSRLEDGDYIDWLQLIADVGQYSIPLSITLSCTHVSRFTPNILHPPETE